MNKGLLTFDEDSPLFVKKRTTKKKVAKRKPRKAKPAVVEDIVIEDIPPPKRKRKAKKKPVNPNAPKYKINGLEDCKHILPKFKKQMATAWDTLENGSLREAGDISSYIRGVSCVAKNTRPKEYEELRLLMVIARNKHNERSKREHD